MSRESRPARGHIKQQEARFIELTLQAGSAVAKKQALQRLCALTRMGYRPVAPMVMKGLIFQSLRDPDAKVRRWAFNSLAQLGTASDVGLIMPALEETRTDIEVFEAGLTTLAHILPKDELAPVLAAWDVSMSNSAVMALAQQSRAYEDELSRVHIQIDTASLDEIRSGTLLVGLQKAPEGLFSRHHPVTEVVGVLNDHDDPIIAQYSYWAAAEHPTLGLAQMRVQPPDFYKLKPNVQGWAIRVLTQDHAAARKHYDIIVAASESDDYQIRDGLASGIIGLYYDSLDTTVLDWYLEEKDASIKEKLLEHMCAQGGNSSGYREQAERAFKFTGPGSALRARLEAACGCEELSLTFRKIELQTNDPDLFAHISRPQMNTTINQSISGQNVTGVSATGTGNTGDIQIFTLAEAQSTAGPILGKLETELAQVPDHPAINEGKAAVAEAIKNPTKPNVEVVIKWLKNFKLAEDVFSAVLKSAESVAHELHQILPHIPHHF